MPTDPNMTGLIYPTEDASEDVWDTIMNATCWPVIGAHDHTTGKGVKVPSGGLKINADVSWSYSGTNYSITDIMAIDFEPVAAASVAGYSSAMFVNLLDSNLYFRNSSGVNVKITDGSTLNVSIVGGIGGDYSSVSALLDYDDATDTYRFRQETSASVRQYAKLGCADIILREYDPAGDATVPVEAVTLKSPDALAASYAVTMPAVLPAATVALQCSATGALSASNAFTGNVSATGTMTATEMHHTMAISLRTNAGEGVESGGAAHTNNLTYWTMGNSTNPIMIRVRVPEGRTITGWGVSVDKGSAGTVTLRGRLMRAALGTTSLSQIGTSQTNSAAAPGSVTMSETGLSSAVTTGTYFVLVDKTAGDPTGDVVYNAYLAHTLP